LSQNTSDVNFEAVLYIGLSGVLNSNLQREIESSGTKINIISARSFTQQKDVLKNKKVIIYGGRNVDCYKTMFENLEVDVRVIYLSTFIGNTFYDAYQQSKVKEFAKLIQAHQNSVSCNIPFIRELLPLNVSKLLSENEGTQSGHYISLVSLADILKDINLCAQGNVSEISQTKIDLTLSLREKSLWFIFSKMYGFAKLFNSKKSLQIVKVLEKSCHLILRTSGLSCVFIQKSFV
jgi:hypothetical protein